MQYLFLILFTLFTFSSPADAAPSKRNTRNTAPAQCKPDIGYRTLCKAGYKYDLSTCRCISTGSSSADANSNNDNSSGNQQSGTVDPSAANQAVQQCRADTISAMSDCDQDKDSGIQGSQTTLSNFAVNMSSQMGIQGACSGIGKALMGANAAVTAFSYMCSSAKTKCMNSCNSAMEMVQNMEYSSSTPTMMLDIDHNRLNCRNLETKVKQASEAMQNMVGAISGAQSCAEQTGTDLFNYCQSNPSAIGCANVAQDCSNPSVAASNPICICKANPTASNCVAMNLKAGDSGFQDGGGGASMNGIANGKGGTNADGIEGLLGDVSWQGDPTLKPSQGPADDAGGAKGGRPLMEGGAGGSTAGGGGGGAGGAGTTVAVNSGFRGGGGGGGGWGSYSGGQGEYAGNPQAPGQPGAHGPDLRQFLPGGKFDPKNRGLAGISGPDGITGPHTDIWKKINNRYQVEQHKLMP